MKYLRTETYIGDAESGEDAVTSTEVLEIKLAQAEEQIAAYDGDSDGRYKLQLDAGYILLDLDRKAEAWAIGKSVFDAAIQEENWLRTVEAADVMFQSEQDDAIKALAHGIWLAVTFPVDPELTVAMLQHLVEETPDKSDGAAVAAATAAYVVDLRAEGQNREDLKFFTNQLLGDVARRHSQVDEQEVFDFWVERMELNDPSKFLPRLAKVLDVITNEAWWYDRDALRTKIPAE